MDRRWKRLLVATAPLWMGGLLALHFGATLINQMPANPLKLRLARGIERYMNPYFTQKWELFAPNPVVDTKELLVSCRVQSGAGPASETEWTNITAPLRRLKYRFRLSPADRLERVQTAALHLGFPPDDPLVAKLRKQHLTKEEYQHALAGYDEAKKRQHELALRLLARVASAECDRLYGGAVRAVRVRLLSLAPPPFSQRQLPDAAGEAHYFDFDWRPYEAIPAI